MQIFQRGILPPVQFAELDATMQSSMLAPAGAKTISFADLAASMQASTLPPEGGRQIVHSDLDLDTFHTFGGAGIVIGAANTQIISVGGFNFSGGEIILVDWLVGGTKGATAGAVFIAFEQTAGTATIVLPNNLNNGLNLVGRQVIANEGFYHSGMFRMRVSAAGSATLRMFGTSAGSDLTSAANLCALQFTVLN